MVDSQENYKFGRGAEGLINRSQLFILNTLTEHTNDVENFKNTSEPCQKRSLEVSEVFQQSGLQLLPSTPAVSPLLVATLNSSCYFSSIVLSVGCYLHLLLPLYSAGVGRTGTYIAIDAMLESAEKIKTVFIQNYVQVMRRSRPHMIQKDVS